jgi:hypothetical protein
MRNQKGNVIVLVLVAVLACVGVFFLIKQKPPTINPQPSTTTTPEASSDTITYKNAKYGFTFKYSKKFAQKIDSEGRGLGLIPTGDSVDATEDVIYITTVHKTGDEVTSKMALSEYAKIAGPQEIQNYVSLASIETIATKNGDVGYRTTWNRSGPFANGVELSSGKEPSEPITYFDLPGDPYYTVQIRLNDVKYLQDYEEIIRSFSSK